MPRGKSIARLKDKITVSSSRSDADDHESLGADQEQAPEAQTFNYDASSSSAMPQNRGGDLFTTRSIYLQVQGLVEGQPFNVSLFCFHNDMFNDLKKKYHLTNAILDL